MALPVTVKMRLQSIQLLQGATVAEDSYALSFIMDANVAPPANAKSVTLSVTGDDNASGDFTVGFQYDVTLGVGVDLVP